MSKKTHTGLVSFCKECLAAKLGYVYSAFGRVGTKSLLDQAASNYPANNLAGGAMREVGEKWLGRRVVDCSGMIKYYLMADKFGDDPEVYRRIGYRGTYQQGKQTRRYFHSARSAGNHFVDAWACGCLYWKWAGD